MPKYVVQFDMHGTLRPDRHGEMKPHYVTKGNVVEYDEEVAEEYVKAGALKPMEDVEAERKAAEEANAAALKEAEANEMEARKAIEAEESKEPVSMRPTGPRARRS